MPSPIFRKLISEQFLKIFFLNPEEILPRYFHLWSPGCFWLFPDEPSWKEGSGIEFAAMPVHQMLFFIRTVHFNKILGTFDKTVFKEQSC